MSAGKSQSSSSSIAGSRSSLPAAGDFDSWASFDWSNGVLIDDLAPHDRLTVQTRNSTYEIIVTCPQTAEVLVRGGAFFPNFTRAHVAGSSLGGSFLKLHGVYAGFQLELVNGGIPVITTPVRTVIMASAEHDRIM
jgi:hypothetical protein